VNNKTIIVLTLKGEGELQKSTSHLPVDIKRILRLIDGRSSLEDLSKRAAPSLRPALTSGLQQLAIDGFIQHVEKSTVVQLKKQSAPSVRFGVISKLRELVNGGFTQHTVEVSDMPRKATLKIVPKSDKAKIEEQEPIHAIIAEKKRMLAELETALINAELEVATAQAEAKIFAEAEEAQLKAEQEALEAQLEADARILAKLEEVRFKADQEVAEAQLQMDMAEAEAKILAEAEAARFKAEQDALEAQLEMAKVEAEAGILAEAEAALLYAEQELAAVQAEARILAEEEEARLKKEIEAQLEMAQARAEEARIAAEAKARAEAESARIIVTEDNHQGLGAATVSGGTSGMTSRSKSGGLHTGFEFLSSLASPHSAPGGILNTLREKLFNTHENSVARTQSTSLNTQKENSNSRTDDLNNVLKTLQNSSPGIEASALISTDGLMIASVMGQDMDATRVGAMTATLLSLGTRAGTELRRSELREVIVSGDNGYAVMANAGRGVVLLILATQTTPLGLLFIDMRDAVEAVKIIL
jgi:predicted regulator of Ras-like GTPase activity (Roadblock/LC7/MglB family)